MNKTITHEEATLAAEAMSGIRYFPSATAARALIVDELVQMCQNFEQAMWLARRLSQLFTEWPGMKELRAIFCSKFMPQDGIENYSEVFLEGVPSERESLPALTAGVAFPAITAAPEASEAVDVGQLAAEVSQARKMPPLPKFRARHPEEIRVDNELRRLYGLAPVGEER